MSSCCSDGPNDGKAVATSLLPDGEVVPVSPLGKYCSTTMPPTALLGPQLA